MSRAFCAAVAASAALLTAFLLPLPPPAAALTNGDRCSSTSQCALASAALQCRAVDPQNHGSAKRCSCAPNHVWDKGKKECISISDLKKPNNEAE